MGSRAIHTLSAWSPEPPEFLQSSLVCHPLPFQLVFPIFWPGLFSLFFPSNFLFLGVVAFNQCSGHKFGLERRSQELQGKSLLVGISASSFYFVHAERLIGTSVFASDSVELWWVFGDKGACA